MGETVKNLICVRNYMNLYEDQVDVRFRVSTDFYQQTVLTLNIGTMNLFISLSLYFILSQRKFSLGMFNFAKAFTQLVIYLMHGLTWGFEIYLVHLVTCIFEFGNLTLQWHLNSFSIFYPPILEWLHQLNDGWVPWNNEENTKKSIKYSRWSS